MRFAWTFVGLAVVAAACTSAGTTVDETFVTSSTASTASTSTQPDSAPTTSVATTSSPPAESSPEPPDLFSYAVIAEKTARRLAIVGLTTPCPADGIVCDLVPSLVVDLPDRPHNITSLGSAVYATHPTSGTVTRTDIATGDVLTANVGREPHDVKYDAATETIVIADEAGRSLLRVDPQTLETRGSVDLPGEPHDFIVVDGVYWVTLIGRSDLVRVVGDEVDVVTAGGSPHDLIMDRTGSIWYSNWGSKQLNIFDPASGLAPDAPAGVGEPQHFAVAPDGAIWISDIAAGAIVGFTSEDPQIVPVGDSPHHLAFMGDVVVVAVSGSGEAVFVRDGQIVGRSELTTGLHGVAIVELSEALVP